MWLKCPDTYSRLLYINTQYTEHNKTFSRVYTFVTALDNLFCRKFPSLLFKTSMCLTYTIVINNTIVASHEAPKAPEA